MGDQNMLKLSVVEFIFRAIPEGFLVVFAMYSFSKTAIYLKRYIISSVLFATLVYIIRLLPIHYGVNTILSLIALIVIAVNINKIDMIKSIRVGIISTILEFICEGINVFIIQYVFKKDVNYVFNDPNLKVLYGAPSLLIFGCIVLIYYIRSLRRKELR
jgi:hypothetical protein